MRHLYDEQLYGVLDKTGAAYDQRAWASDRVRISQEERTSFLNNEIENPRFIYRAQKPKPDYEEYLSLFYKELKKSTAPAVVIDLYERKIEKLQVFNLLLQASIVGDDEAFFNNSVQFYGRPQKKFFSYLAKRVVELCKACENIHPTPARRLQKIFNRINTDNNDINSDILPPVVTGGREIASIAEVEEIFRETVSRYGIEGWSVEVDSNNLRSIFAVNRASKKIFIPSEEKILSRPIKPTDIGIQAIAEHEIGVHARRVDEASRSSLRLLESGLDDCLRGEEGVATYVQQQVEGASEFYGFDRYLAASLAIGMDGEERDFRSVFGLMVDFYTLQLDSGSDGDYPARIRAAWDVCVRIFRGTTGQSAGRIYTKDIVYMEGNIGVWHLLSEKPHIFPYLFVGKYNPLLKRHVNTLQTLEIMPEW